mgnify:CR=1 FL=1|nr:MAG TPA: hypothetical protein [Caudoviricetes sp.]
MALNMDNEIVWLLLHDLEEGKITANQFRTAVTNAEIENLKKNIDSLYWGYAQSLNSSPYGNIWKRTEFTTKENRNADTVDPLHYEMCKDSSNPCEGCSNLTSLYVDGEVFEQCCEDRTCPIWLKDHPKDKIKRVKTLTVEEWKQKTNKEEKPANPCAGCKFRKYHDWAEPTWTGFSAHYYDCENPSCPNWNRLWWRNNDDGSPLLDQEPIKLKRKIQHVAYALVTWMNNVISTISEEI